MFTAIHILRSRIFCPCERVEQERKPPENFTSPRGDLSPPKVNLSHSRSLLQQLLKFLFRWSGNGEVFLSAASGKASMIWWTKIAAWLCSHCASLRPTRALVDVRLQKSVMEGLHLKMDFSKHEGVCGFRNTYIFKSIWSQISVIGNSVPVKVEFGVKRNCILWGLQEDWPQTSSLFWVLNWTWHSAGTTYWWPMSTPKQSIVYFPLPELAFPKGHSWGTILQ